MGAASRANGEIPLKPGKPRVFGRERANIRRAGGFRKAANAKNPPRRINENTLVPVDADGPAAARDQVTTIGAVKRIVCCIFGFGFLLGFLVEHI